MRKTFTGSGVLGRQGTNCVSVRMLLRTESAQLRLLTLANGGLRDRPDQDLLGGGVKPGWRQRADDRPPDTLLNGIEFGRRCRSLAREDRRYHRHRDGRLATTRHQNALASTARGLGFDLKAPGRDSFKSAHEPRLPV
jgi:hypothetical protein